ncbi:MAG: hypothetical protein IKL10_03945 [Clostridia bacterium]|nr:hypothetical protein [Clostridia bacterium]
MNKIKIISALMCAVSIFFMSSCVRYSSFEELAGISNEITTGYEYQTSENIENTTTVIIENTTGAFIPENTTVQTVPETTEPVTTRPSAPQTTRPQEITTAAPVNPETTVPSVEEPDYAAFTKAEILDTYTKALNKTRGYTGALSVINTEAFDAEVKEANPGGALTELLADNIIKLVGSEGQQTLEFSNGKAVNKDGETIPILLPLKTSFSLPEEGLASASISKKGDKLYIKMTLVPETVTMGQVPKYNSSAIGYLDTSDMDFVIVKLSRVDITYTGSVIDAVIRSDGYIESVNYTINMSTYAELSGMGITGYGTLEGAQTEKWELQW